MERRSLSAERGGGSTRRSYRYGSPRKPPPPPEPWTDNGSPPGSTCTFHPLSCGGGSHSSSGLEERSGSAVSSNFELAESVTLTDPSFIAALLGRSSSDVGNQSRQRAAGPGPDSTLGPKCCSPNVTASTSGSVTSTVQVIRACARPADASWT